MTSVTVNGERKEFKEGILLSEMIDGLNLPEARIAVEINRNVVRKSLWSETEISDSDVIEIVHFVGGG